MKNKTKNMKGIWKVLLSVVLAFAMVISPMAGMPMTAKAEAVGGTSAFEHMDVSTGFNVALVAPQGATKTQLENVSTYSGYTGPQAWATYGGIATKGYVESKGKDAATATRYSPHTHWHM